VLRGKLASIDRTTKASDYPGRATAEEVAALVARIGLKWPGSTWGWDTHQGWEGGADLRSLPVRRVGRAGRVPRGSGSQLENVVVLVMTEFDALIAEKYRWHRSRSRLRHMFGGPVRGGVARQVAGLGPAALRRRDLAVTTDYRDVLAERHGHAGAREAASVVPGHALARSRPAEAAGGRPEPLVPPVPGPRVVISLARPEPRIPGACAHHPTRDPGSRLLPAR
jgi:uncharacterized protein (DUF1501 family)